MLKPGYKTTEFLALVLANVGAVAASLDHALSPHWAAIVAAISVSAYSLSRGLAKLSPPPVAVTQPVAVAPAPVAPVGP